VTKVSVFCQKKGLDVLIFIKRINGNLAKYLALKKRGREKFVLTGLADMIEA
jgi:hypothetical protein